MKILVEEPDKLPNVSELYYPGAIDWMWNYCHNLGKYTMLDGTKADLGVYTHDHDYADKLSNATVWSDMPGHYSSGDLNEAFMPFEKVVMKYSNNITPEFIHQIFDGWLMDREIVRRAWLKGIISLDANHEAWLIGRTSIEYINQEGKLLHK